MAISETIEVKTSPSEVFAFLANVENESQWRRDVKSARLESGDPGVPGAVYVEHVQPGGAERGLGALAPSTMGATITATITLTDVVPERRIAFDFTAGPMKGKGSYEVAADGDANACLVTYELDLGKGLMAKAASGMVKKQVRRDLDSLPEVFSS